MNKDKFLLLKVMEECAEVSQRASKLIQFGWDEVEAGQELNNQQRFQNEVTDLICVLQMLNSSIVTPVKLHTTLEEFSNKVSKINKYHKYAKELGEL